jgi:hypothetical protein
VASTLPRDQIGPALIADSGIIRSLAADSTTQQLSAMIGGEHLLGLAARCALQEATCAVPSSRSDHAMRSWRGFGRCVVQ